MKIKLEYFFVNITFFLFSNKCILCYFQTVWGIKC